MVTTAAKDDKLDARFGFGKYVDGPTRTGWLLNIQPTVTTDKETNQCKSAVDLYFLQEDGHRFKICLPFCPYFLIRVKDGTEAEVEQYLRRKFEGKLLKSENIQKEDLDLKNHLIGLTQTYMKLSFLNVQDLMHVRNKLRPIVNKNKNKKKSAYDDATFRSAHGQRAANARSKAGRSVEDVTEYLLDLREYDVPYPMRVTIDLNFNVSKWYDVTVSNANPMPEMKFREDLVAPAEPSVMAWDIETTKLPLKFPNAEFDQIMMVSYMIDGQGYLINNREIIAADVEDFEYTPKPEYEGPFEVFNEPDEEALLKRCVRACLPRCVPLSARAPRRCRCRTRAAPGLAQSLGRWPPRSGFSVARPSMDAPPQHRGRRRLHGRTAAS